MVSVMCYVVAGLITITRADTFTRSTYIITHLYDPFASLILAVDTQSSSTSHFLIDRATTGVLLAAATSSSATADEGINMDDSTAPHAEVRNALRDTSFSDTALCNGVAAALVWDLADGEVKADEVAKPEMSKLLTLIVVSLMNAARLQVAMKW